MERGSVGGSYTEDGKGFFPSVHDDNVSRRTLTLGGQAFAPLVREQKTKYYAKRALLSGVIFTLGAAAFISFLKALAAITVFTLAAGAVAVSAVGLAAVGLGILFLFALYYGVRYCQARTHAKQMDPSLSEDY